MEVVFILIGVVLGAVIGFLMGRSRSNALSVKLAIEEKELERVKSLMDELKEHNQAALNAKDQAHKELLRAQEERHQEAVEAMEQRFRETMDKVTAQVKTATESMLKDRQKEFAESSSNNLGQIVTPLRETIEKMKRAMDENTAKQTSMRKT